MPFEVTTTRWFAAAHAVRLADGTVEDLHGHNWRVQVTVRAAGLDPAGMVMDFHELERAVEAVLAPWRQRNLNQLAPFTTLNPTAENLALTIAQRLKLPPQVSLLAVEVWETHENSAVYRPG